MTSTLIKQTTNDKKKKDKHISKRHYFSSHSISNQVKKKKTKVTQDLSSRLIKCLLNTSIWISSRHLKFNVYLRKQELFQTKMPDFFPELPILSANPVGTT